MRKWGEVIRDWKWDCGPGWAQSRRWVVKGVRESLVVSAYQSKRKGTSEDVLGSMFVIRGEGSKGVGNTKDESWSWDK